MCTVYVSEEPNCSTNASQLKKSWTGKEQRALEQLLPFFPADPLAIPELCYREQCALYSWQSGGFAAFLCRRPLLQWLIVQLVTPEAFYDQVPISTRKVSNNYWQYSKCILFNYIYIYNCAKYQKFGPCFKNDLLSQISTVLEIKSHNKRCEHKMSLLTIEKLRVDVWPPAPPELLCLARGVVDPVRSVVWFESSGDDVKDVRRTFCFDH